MRPVHRLLAKLKAHRARKVAQDRAEALRGLQVAIKRQDTRSIHQAEKVAQAATLDALRRGV